MLLDALAVVPRFITVLVLFIVFFSASSLPAAPSSSAAPSTSLAAILCALQFVNTLFVAYH